MLRRLPTATAEVVEHHHAMSAGVRRTGVRSCHRDMSGRHLNGAIVATVASAGGHGYYLVGSDGGTFSFGDARFFGSTGNRRLTTPIVGIAPTPDNGGYWLVGSDGGVFDFSNRPFLGSLAGSPLPEPIIGPAAIAG